MQRIAHLTLLVWILLLGSVFAVDQSGDRTIDQSGDRAIDQNGDKPETDDGFIHVVGTGVHLKPPPGFVVSDSFVGFENEAAGSSIKIEEYARSAKEVITGLDDATLKKQGMKVLKRLDAEIAGDENAALLFLSTTLGGRPFNKWLAVFGDKNNAVLITATYPEERHRDFYIPNKLALKQARWRPKRGVDPFAELGIQLTVPSGFKFAKDLGPRLAFTQSGEYPIEGIDDAIYSVSRFQKLETIPDKKNFSRFQLQKSKQLRRCKIKKSNPLANTELDAYEVMGYAYARDSSNEIVVHQVIVFVDDGFYALLGMGPRYDREKLIKLFRSSARSFRKAKSKPKK